MTSKARTTFSISVLAVCVVVAVTWSFTALLDGSDDAARAAADYSTVQVSARHLEAARTAGGTSRTTAAELPTKLDQAMKTAEIDSEDLVRITPQPPRRLGTTGLREMPSQLVFRQLTLAQVLTFITALSPAGSELTVRDLHLTLPGETVGTGTDAGWNVELTVSYVNESQPAGDPRTTGN